MKLDRMSHCRYSVNVKPAGTATVQTARSLQDRFVTNLRRGRWCRSAERLDKRFFKHFYFSLFVGLSSTVRLLAAGNVQRGAKGILLQGGGEGAGGDL